MPAGTSIRVEGGIPNVTMPSFDKSFRPGKVKEIMADVLKSRLEGLEYDPDNCSTWCREISDEVKQRLKLLGMERYKWVVQVVIGEQKGAGVQMGCRCFWDPKPITSRRRSSRTSPSSPSRSPRGYICINRDALESDAATGRGAALGKK